MPTKILVATPDPAFGEWLQASLVENGGYDVHLVQTGSEVLPSAADHSFAVAILDSDLPGEAFVPLARALIAQLPGLRLLVIPPENNPHHPNLAGLVPQGYLFRPFYLPGLLDTLHSLLVSNGSRDSGVDDAPVEVDSPVQTWLEDPGQAGRELARLLLETGAQTALIAAEGRLWASAGQISPAAAGEAAALLANCWQEGQAVDLARFVRLEAGGSEHLLYAAPLLDELTVALLFQPSTPLTRAHRESARLTRALSAAVAERPLPDRAALIPPAAEPELEPEAAIFPDETILSGWLPAGVEAMDENAPDLPTSPAVEPEPWSSDDLRAALLQPAAEPEPEPEAAIFPDETIHSGWLPAGVEAMDENAPDLPTSPAVEPEPWSSDELRAALTGPDLPAADELLEADAEGEEAYADEPPTLDLASFLAGMPSPDPDGEAVFPAAEWAPEPDDGLDKAGAAFSGAQTSADEAVAARLDALIAPAAPANDQSDPILPAAEPAPIPVASPSIPAVSEAEEPTVEEVEPAPAQFSARAPEMPGILPEPAPGPAVPVTDGNPQPPTPEIPAWLAQPSGGETRPLPVESGKTGPVKVRAARDPLPDRPASDRVPTQGRPKNPRALPVTAGVEYTCILIPERPDHYLTGDLAGRLELWVPQLCLAFGWRLAGMVVRPGYLQWTVDLDPNVSPGNVVRVIRQRSSERVFSQFPALRYGLARNDFWAPGYLAVRGPRPPSTTLLDGFIRQTRARQRY